MADATLHQRLRVETAPAHEALERELDWQAQVATLTGYRALLGRLHGFHAVWEPAIAEALADGDFFEDRRRLAALGHDLAFLGLSGAEIGRLPQAQALSLTGPAGAMGALYVLEGSTLGGRVIGKHITAVHGLLGDGLAYYSGHGNRTGAMWAAFRSRLDSFEGEADAVVAAATETFDALRIWLVPGR